ncbi:MAG: MarR family transcriptional regulator [Candidatus Marsarchaeota archaeon]|nr:MarR family transcriptional regulator [Candidatus Marsarchaeota archaeon]
MPRLDPYESLGFHCNLTLKAFLAALEDRLKGTGVSPAQFMALAHLTALGALSQKSLSNLLSITPATTVRLVDRMERDGWVTRSSDPNDGRVNLVAPTAEATKVWEDVSQMARAMLNQAYRGIHPAEIETVKRVLERVRRNLGA